MPLFARPHFVQLRQLSALLASGLVVAACAGKPEPKAPAPPAATTGAQKQPLPSDIVALSVHGFYAVDNTSGTRLEPEAFFDRLASVDAVCFGESHDNPKHHYAQLRTLNALMARAPAQSRRLAVGFEVFQVPFQLALDAYASGKLDEPGLLEASEYEQRWGYDFSLYRPLLESARGKAPLLALNAKREVTRSIAKGGMGALKSSDAHSLPELDLTDDAHRGIFDSAMKTHPAHPGMNLDYMYLAQVVWDETMAATVAEFMQADPKVQVLVIAGLGHCHRSAIPSRIQRRLEGARVLSVRPRLASETPEPGEGLPIYDLDWVIEE